MLKRALAVIGILFTVFVILFVVLITVALFQLPSPSQIAAFLKGKTVAEDSSSRPVDASDPASTNIAKTDLGSNAATVELRADTKKNLERAEDEIQKKAINDYLLQRYVDNPGRPLSVCANMGEIRSAMPFDSFDQLTTAISRLAFHQDTYNPFVESFMAPVAYVFQIPSVRDLLLQVKNANLLDDESLLNRAQFYAKLTQVTMELAMRKSVIERISAHAYHLFVLSRAVYKNPSLATDEKTKGFCQQLEAAISGEHRVDPDKEAIEVQSFLNYAQISAAEVDYDPNLGRSIVFQADRSGLAFEVPWMSRILNFSPTR